MALTYETLLVTQPAPHVTLVTLNRPEASNAVNTRMGQEMLQYFEDLSLDLKDTRCVILTGAGDKAFCAGGDLKERKGMTDEAWQRQHVIFERKVRAVMACPVPVIAAVNGHAYAGGLEMALACDFAYAVPGARFALTEVTIGIMPGAGGTQNLPRAVGERRAKEIILAGRPFSAAEALEWGVLNRVVEPDQLVPAALETAKTIAGNAPMSVRQAKKSIHLGLQMDLRSGLRFEVEAYNRLIGTEDRMEGIAAFNEKRKPQFRNR